EYDAFGFPTDHRYSRFEEQVGILRALLDGDLVTFTGRFHRTRDAVLAPPPPRRVPILIAGEGPRMMPLAAPSADASHADWFGATDERLTSAPAAFDDALRAEGRDPSTIDRTVGVTVRDPAMAVDPADEPAFRGSAEEMAEMFGRYAGLGIHHLILEIGPKT